MSPPITVNLSHKETPIPVPNWGLYKKGQLEDALELLRKGWENKPIYNHLYFMHLEEAEHAATESNIMLQRQLRPAGV